MSSQIDLFERIYLMLETELSALEALQSDTGLNKEELDRLKDIAQTLVRINSLRATPASPADEADPAELAALIGSVEARHGVK